MADILYHVVGLDTAGSSLLLRGYSLNNRGQVVGSAETSTGVEYALLYSYGQMFDLNDWIDQPCNAGRGLRLE
jgi:probable HAF family extracellular repeat protein